MPVRLKISEKRAVGLTHKGNSPRHHAVKHIQLAGISPGVARSKRDGIDERANLQWLNALKPWKSNNKHVDRSGAVASVMLRAIS